MNPTHMENELNCVPEQVRAVHILGICGTGMAALAGMLKNLGFQVTGSDQSVYPPMSTLLEELNIPVISGYRAENIPDPVDLVIVGNVIRRDNPEARAMRLRRLPFLSMPQALHHFFIRGNRSVVVSGTHGKTTTSGMIAWILEHSGRDPGFMIGGILRNFGRNHQVAKGGVFVTEGDEYDTAYFDKGPKFLHFCPELLVVTNIEFDHGDIYRDVEQIKAQFGLLLDRLPPHGVLVASGEDPKVRSLLPRTRASVQTYGLGGSEEWCGRPEGFREGNVTVRITRRGELFGRFRLPMIGNHNVRNALAAVALTHNLGLEPDEIFRALEEFQGVKRRQEVRGSRRGVLVMDDFAHHPTEVRETLRAVRGAYENRRLVCVFEPRTNTSRRNVFQHVYPGSFEGADLVIVREPPDLNKVPEGQRFSSKQLVADLQARGQAARYFSDTEGILDFLLKDSREGDLVLVLSNGGFDGIHDRLLASL